MPSYSSELEQTVLENLRPNLEAEGFEVVIHPSRSVLPSFMRGYVPDAIALKGDKRIAIEVKAKSATAERDLRRIRDLFLDRPEWEFRIIYVPSGNELPSINAPSKKEVETLLDALPKIIKDAGSVAALVIAWSAFEAAARLLLPDKLNRPQPPARLLEILASDGYVTPSEADMLRDLSRTRNRAAHGDLDIPITAAKLRDLINLIRALLQKPLKTKQRISRP